MDAVLHLVVPSPHSTVAAHRSGSAKAYAHSALPAITFLSHSSVVDPHSCVRILLLRFRIVFFEVLECFQLGSSFLDLFQIFYFLGVNLDCYCELQFRMFVRLVLIFRQC